jgi:hypothetical protein
MSLGEAMTWERRVSEMTATEASCDVLLTASVREQSWGADASNEPACDGKQEWTFEWVKWRDLPKAQQMLTKGRWCIARGGRDAGDEADDWSDGWCMLMVLCGWCWWSVVVEREEKEEEEKRSGIATTTRWEIKRLPRHAWEQGEEGTLTDTAGSMKVLR